MVIWMQSIGQQQKLQFLVESEYGEIPFSLDGGFDSTSFYEEKLWLHLKPLNFGKWLNKVSSSVNLVLFKLKTVKISVAHKPNNQAVGRKEPNNQMHIR